MKKHKQFDFSTIFYWIGKPFLIIFIIFTRLFSVVGKTTIFFVRQIVLLVNFLIFKAASSFLKIFSQKIRLPRVNFKKRLFLLLAFLIVFFFFSLYFYQTIIKDLPSPDQLSNRDPALTTKIYDRNGELLYKIYRQQNRTLVKLENVPQFLIDATIAAEDKEFWNHSGISAKGIFRAVVHNLSNPEKNPIGGSTITQQLVKNALLDSEKTWQRKIKEAILSVMVETKYSKKEILQMYLNEIPYGGTSYGIEEAAQKYFSSTTKDLTKSQAALLAGLPASPTRYSPFGAYPTLAKKRQIQVVKEMVNAKFITDKEGEEIKNAPLRFASQKEEIKAPHFVFYIKDLLVEKMGQKIIEEGGLTITTSLDLQLQEKVEKIVSQEINKLKNYHVTNGAVLVVKPGSGEILAMVGSKNYFDLENDGNVNVTLRPRQPGSSIKPINYAYSFSIGFTPATIVQDNPITYQIPGQLPYSPKNYDGKFRGSVSLRTALGSSLNIPAVKVLAACGVENMIETGKKMGITTWEDSSRFGLSLTLGGGEVKMIDLTQAYSVFANLGQKVDINPILKIVNHHQSFNQLTKKETLQVIDPEVSFIINDILADNNARTPAFGASSLLNIPGKKVAVKTGTSNNLRDNWTIGYTADFLVAVWVGNNDNSPMSSIASGITGASPIWRKVTELLLEKYPQTGWEKPKDIVEIPICKTTGTLACLGCPQVGKEYFLSKFVPKKTCSFTKPQSETTNQ
jgi:penicillin-binding protein 1C